MADRPKRITDVVKEYGRALYAFIRGRVRTEADAEDVLQDVWTQFASQPEVEAIEQVSGWLYRVARNRITDRYRKKTTTALEDLAYEDDDGELGFREILLADDHDPDLAELKRIFWEELMAGLEELPANQRAVFAQNELEEKTLQQIADEQGENLKTIISRKRYAVMKLRERLNTIYSELING
ncbi:MAG: sigma-70 family RNA polymerase sigma factor [Flavobacteriales bacterium]|nr:sigma-70 family RNA polymerase sigma factor [Flavobacteriales bacterium]